MFGLIDAGRGLFLLGNHDHKLARALAGQQVRIGPSRWPRPSRQLDPALRERAAAEIGRAPAWLRRGDTLFVHGGFHTAMLERTRPADRAERPTGPVSRALFGEPTGRMQPDGYPERSLRWVDRIPAGLTVYCGHDHRSPDGRPYVRAAPPAAGRCSSTPAPARAGICPGSIWPERSAYGAASLCAVIRIVRDYLPGNC